MTITIRLHDVIYLVVCLFNQFPMLCYFGTASVYIPRDQQAVYEINGYFPMLAAASAAMCMMNLLSIFKIKMSESHSESFISPTKQVILVVVPLLVLIMYAFGASTESALRWLDPTSDRPIYVGRYIAWFATVPVLILQGAPLSRVKSETLSWTAALTESYMIGALGAQLAPTVEAKQFWMLVVFSTFLLTAGEAALALRKHMTNDYYSFAMIMGGFFLCNGGVYLLSEVGVLSVTLENTIYGVTDVASKAVFSAYILASRIERMHRDDSKMLALQKYTESLFEQTVAPMCVVRCDDGKIIQWNNAMAEVTQVAEKDAMGKEFVADFLIHNARSGTEAQRFVEIMQLADSELQAINNKVDLRIRRVSTPEGPAQEVELLLSLNRIDSPLGGKVLVCVGQDVTKVLALQRYTESLFEQTVAPMCVVKCDDGKIILWNNAMAEVTKIAETDAIGKEFIRDFLTHSARTGTEAKRFVKIMQLDDSELQEMNNKVDLRIRTASTGEGPRQEVDLLLSLNRIDGPVGGKVLVCVGQ